MQSKQEEWRARFPNAHLSLALVFDDPISTAEHYHRLSGRSLQVYGNIGELYSCKTYGLNLDRNYAQGSDGRICNGLVQVKIITPFKSKDRVNLNLARSFGRWWSSRSMLTSKWLLG